MKLYGCGNKTVRFTLSAPETVAASYLKNTFSSALVSSDALSGTGISPRSVIITMAAIIMESNLLQEYH